MFFTLALFAFFAIALPDAMLGVAWPFMRVTFDQPLAAMTLVLPFGVAATVVSTSGWTWAAARLGLGRLLTGSVALSAVALMCCALAPAYWVIVACAVLFGLSSGAIDAALNAYAARHFGPRQINFMHAAYGIGAATSPLIVTGVVSSGTSWRWAYLAVMIIQGALTILFATSSRRWNEAGAPSPASPNRPRWRPPPRAVAGLLVAAVDCGLESVVGLWAFVFLLEALTLEPAIAGVVVSGYWAALVIGRILLGSVAERVGTWPVLAAATIVAVTAALLLISGQPIATAVGVVLLGLAVAPIYPLLVLTTSERTTASSVDRLVGFQAAATTLGAVTFSSLVGLIMGAALTGFASCVVALALLTAGGIWALKPGQQSSARSTRGLRHPRSDQPPQSGSR
jgi:MFS family permease